jgi:ketosteroid isomerase-like protein
MATAAAAMTNSDQIRALIEGRVRAIDDKDVEALVATAAPGVVSFDALPPLQRVGPEAIRTRLQEWFGWYDGPIGYEVHDLHITAGDDIAFAHYLYHVTGRMTNGKPVDMWVRTTMGLQKTDEGVWAITHEHNSVPFDAESGKASLDLTP